MALWKRLSAGGRNLAADRLSIKGKKTKQNRGCPVNAVLMIRNDFFFLTNLPAPRVSLLLRLGPEELEAVLSVSLQK